jgi:hypothetical protein
VVIHPLLKASNTSASTSASINGGEKGIVIFV